MDNYSYFGLLPKSQSGRFKINNTLNSYVPFSVNTLEVSPNFFESRSLPFDGKIGSSRQIDPVEVAYNDPRLLGVIGNSKEMIQFYQRGTPQFINEHYKCFNIPLQTPQSRYMSDKSIVYNDLMNPDLNVRMPLT